MYIYVFPTFRVRGRFALFVLYICKYSKYISIYIYVHICVFTQSGFVGDLRREYCTHIHIFIYINIYSHIQSL